MTDEYSPQNQNEEDEDYLPEEIDPAYADYDDGQSLKDKAVDTTIDVGKEVAKHEVKKAGKKAAKEVVKKSAEGIAEAAGAETAGIGFLVALAIEAIDRLAQHLKEALKKLKEKRKKIYMMQLATCLTIFMFPFLVGGLVLMTLQKDEAVAGTFSGTACLDPGHSPQSKTSGEAGELEINFKVATELKALLESEGIKVVLTKNAVGDNVENSARPGICQAGGASFMYSLHNDSSVGGKKGPYHIYPRSDRTTIFETSKQYAEILQKTITEELGVASKTTGDQPVNGGFCQEGQSCTRNSLGIMSAGESVGLPVFLVEMVALDAQGRAWINTDANRVKLVRAMADGIKKIPGMSSGTQMSKVPVYYQGDGEPWADKAYCTKDGGYCNSMRASGCGPTSLAMVLSYWTGKKLTPDIVADLLTKGGFRVRTGTDGAGMLVVPKQYGLKTKMIAGSDIKTVKEYLKKGVPIIQRQHCCFFTQNGHFIVLTGLRADGKFTVNDPNKGNYPRTSVATEADVMEGIQESYAIWK